jgi:XisH protein
MRSRFGSGRSLGRVGSTEWRLVLPGQNASLSRLAADKEGRKIAVEIKSFPGASQVEDLEKALGPFTLFHEILGEAASGPRWTTADTHSDIC